MKNAKIVKLWV